MAAVLPLYSMMRDVPDIDYEKIIEIINNEYFEYVEDSLKRIQELIISKHISLDILSKFRPNKCINCNMIYEMKYVFIHSPPL